MAYRFPRWCLGILVALAGCGGKVNPSGGEVDTGVVTETDAGGGCSALACGALCVDPATDVHHCGGCDNDCGAGPGLSCKGGICDAKCSSPFTRCPATKGHKFPYCSDLFNDPANCGGCNFGCSDRANAVSTCTSGKCGVKCDAGFANCDASVATGCEAKLATDPHNCGGCGIECDAGTSCVGGICGGTTGCDAPKKLCGALCVDVSSDVSNCGECGKPCKPGDACAAGTCIVVGTGACSTTGGTALFYGATGSVESPWVSGAGLTIEVANESTWRAKTASDFAKYQLIVIGEPDVGTTTSTMLQAAYDTRATWGSVVNGRMAVLGMPAGTKARDGVIGAVILMKQTMYWLGHGPEKTTSLFVATDWGARGLDYLGAFGVFGESVANGEVATPLDTTHPMLSGSTDTSLSDWHSSVRTLLTTYPASLKSIAKGLGGPLGSTPPPPSGAVLLARDVPCGP
jgi:hypothetical protein